MKSEPYISESNYDQVKTISGPWPYQDHNRTKHEEKTDMTKDREIYQNQDHITRPFSDQIRTLSTPFQDLIKSGPNQDQIRTLSISYHEYFRALTILRPYQDHIRTIHYLMLSNRLGHGVKVESPA